MKGKDSSPIFQEFFLKDDYVIRYDQIREAIKGLLPKFMACITKEAVLRSAIRLEVSQGNSLLLNTEHESDFFFDYCMYTYKKDGVRIVEQGFNRFSSHYEGETLEIFKTAKDGYFAYLEILEPLREEGLIVYDQLKDCRFLLIDRGLNKTVRGSTRKFKVVSHFMDFKDFIMTTGAATPVLIETEAGSKIQKRFEQYFDCLKSGTVDPRETAQYITDMFKICLQENITGNVVSPTAPFGKAALEERIGFRSDVIH